jgi:O-antigen/teichoic acid export membrane protein
VLLIVAVAVLVVGLFTGFRQLGPAAWLTVIIPGIVLLVATPFFGPMPRAAESPR